MSSKSLMASVAVVFLFLLFASPSFAQENNFDERLQELRSQVESGDLSREEAREKYKEIFKERTAWRKSQAEMRRQKAIERREGRNKKAEKKEQMEGGKKGDRNRDDDAEKTPNYKAFTKRLAAAVEAGEISKKQSIAILKMLKHMNDDEHGDDDHEHGGDDDHEHGDDHEGEDGDDKDDYSKKEPVTEDQIQKWESEIMEAVMRGKMSKTAAMEKLEALEKWPIKEVSDADRAEAEAKREDSRMMTGEAHGRLAKYYKELQQRIEAEELTEAEAKELWNAVKEKVRANRSEQRGK